MAGVRTLQQIFGNCAQPLVHRGTVDIAPTLPADATRGALDVYSYQAGGGDAAYGIAARFFGSVQINGETTCFIPIGTIIDWYGTAAALTAATASGVWAVCDGTNGTPDLGGRVTIGYDAGGAFNTIGATGGGTTTGAASGNTGAASGNTGNATTGITVDSHTGLNTDVTNVNTSLEDTGVTATLANHTHTISFTTGTAASGAGVAVVTGITSPTGLPSVNPDQISDPTHQHTANHAHSIATITHTVNESAHNHTLGSHTHDLGSHTHTQALPAYMVLVKLMRIA